MQFLLLPHQLTNLQTYKLKNSQKIRGYPWGKRISSFLRVYIVLFGLSQERRGTLCNQTLFVVFTFLESIIERKFPFYYILNLYQISFLTVTVMMLSDSL